MQKIRQGKKEYDYETHEFIYEIRAKEEISQEEIAKAIEMLSKPKRRSLNANSYAWVLIQKIADASGNTKEETYREIIRDKGIFRTVTLDNKSVATFIHLWNKNGLGWLCDTLNKGNTTTDLIAYYGTSSYNNKQMAKLIDYIVQEAQELGIETMTPNEIAELKGRWGNE